MAPLALLQLHPADTASRASSSAPTPIWALPFLLVVRAAQALGAAAALSVFSAILRAIYPARQLGRGLGINGVVVSSSAALAPALGGFVLGVAPWPWVFACAVPFAVLSLLLGRAVPDTPPAKSSYDLLGAAMSAATSKRSRTLPLT